jgi:putative oxidoreductase
MNNNLIQGISTVLGRVMLATIFLMSAVGNKIPNFSDVAGYMAGEGVPEYPMESVTPTKQQS